MKCILARWGQRALQNNTIIPSENEAAPSLRLKPIVMGEVLEDKRKISSLQIGKFTLGIIPGGYLHFREDGQKSGDEKVEIVLYGV